MPHRAERDAVLAEDRAAGRHSLVALWSWCFISWALLIPTATVEVGIIGAVVAIGVGLALRPLGGRVAGPWTLLWPPCLARALVLAGDTAVRVVRANLKLATAAWRPGGGRDTGVIAVPTRVRTEGEVLLVGVLTSLIVDNQLVDIDDETHQLWFHAIGLPDDADRTDAINGPVEDRIFAMTRGRHG